MNNPSPDGHQCFAWSDLPLDPSVGAQRVELPGGQVVFEPGSAADRVFFVHSGQVRTFEAGPDESARLLEILGPGDWFGEESLASAASYSSRAVAVSDAVLWAVPVDSLMDSLGREPRPAMELIRQLASRLQRARQDASRFVFDDCSARLVKTLLRFSATAAATLADDGSVTLRITHGELAQAVGAARETVSLALTQLREQNLVRTGRNRLMFNPVSLRTVSSNGGNPVASVLAGAEVFSQDRPRL